MTLVFSRGIQLIFTVKAYSHGVTMIATVLLSVGVFTCCNGNNGFITEWAGSLLDISMVTLINMGPIN